MAFASSVIELLTYISLMGMMVLLNALFFVFTFQRHFYFFGYCNVEKPRDIRVSLVSKDKNDVDLYLFDKQSRNDLVYMSGNMIYMKEHLDFCEFLSQTFDCNVISMVYRGVAGNARTPSERGIVEDIKALGQYLDKRIVTDRNSAVSRTRKVVLGFSIGSAASIHLANVCSVDSLVLINPFMSLASVVETSRFAGIVKPLLVDKWDNMRNIRNVAIPIYFITSERDEIVPSYHSEGLIRNTRSHEKHIIADASHNTPVSSAWEFRSCVSRVVFKALRRIEDNRK